jgi:hypothetical protein
LFTAGKSLIWQSQVCNAFNESYTIVDALNKLT